MGDRAFTLVCYILLRLGLVSFSLLTVSLLYCFRNRMRYEMVRSVLYFNGKKVVKQSDVTKRVKYEYVKRRGLGHRRMHHSLKEDVCLSENAIINVLSRDGQHQRMTARFVNRAPHQNIKSTGVHYKLQVDLVDMSRSRVLYECRSYGYVLCVLDVFSRYVWLRPLQNKKAGTVLVRFREILEEFGYPLVVQHDCGTEFRSCVAEWLKRKHVIVKTSRPYHPQSQGKVERMNQILKNKWHLIWFSKAC